MNYVLWAPASRTHLPNTRTWTGFQRQSLCWGVLGGLQICCRTTQDPGQKLQEGREKLTEKPDIGTPFTEQAWVLQSKAETSVTEEENR